MGQGWNPYRIPRPREGLIFKGKFYEATPAGRMVEQSMIGTRKLDVRVTDTSCWLSPEITIPISSIVDVIPINGDRAVEVRYQDALAGRTESAFLCALTLFGFYDRKAVLGLRDVLLSQRSKAPSLDQVLLAGGVGPAASLPGCERCGDPLAAYADLGYVLCFGIIPFAGVYAWAPRRRYVCVRHAHLLCVYYCLLTLCVGYWGFPGVVAAPLRVAANLASLRRHYRASPTFTVSVGLVAALLPACAAGYGLYRLFRLVWA